MQSSNNSEDRRVIDTLPLPAPYIKYKSKNNTSDSSCEPQRISYAYPGPNATEGSDQLSVLKRSDTLICRVVLRPRDMPLFDPPAVGARRQAHYFVITSQDGESIEWANMSDRPVTIDIFPEAENEECIEIGRVKGLFSLQRIREAECPPRELEKGITRATAMIIPEAMTDNISFRVPRPIWTITHQSSVGILAARDYQRSGGDDPGPPEGMMHWWRMDHGQTFSATFIRSDIARKLLDIEF